jgi:hypothetical protein
MDVPWRKVLPSRHNQSRELVGCIIAPNGHGRNRGAALSAVHQFVIRKVSVSSLRLTWKSSGPTWTASAKPAASPPVLQRRRKVGPNQARRFVTIR